MVACDEQSPAQGGEKEEPKELPSDCKVIIYDGLQVLRAFIDEIKQPFYEYNSLISNTGYYLKPVHKVYKKLPNGKKRIYEYYGRYWWKKVGSRWIYAGNIKPKIIRYEPPRHPLEGLSIIIEDKDIIMNCRDYSKFKSYFKGLTVKQYYQ